jgi:hypothetical protein
MASVRGWNHDEQEHYTYGCAMNDRADLIAHGDSIETGERKYHILIASNDA